MNDNDNNQSVRNFSWLQLLLTTIGIAVFFATSGMLLFCEADGVRPIVGVFLVVGFIICHLVAIKKVNQGAVTVYRDWKDFGCSFAWTLLFPLSYAMVLMGVMCESSGAKWAFWLFAGVLSAIGVGCLVWMFVGSFANNKGRVGASILALAARIVGAVFMMTYVCKWINFFNNKKQMTIYNYIVAFINLLIFGWIFNHFVVPLVVDNRSQCVVEG